MSYRRVGCIKLVMKLRVVDKDLIGVDTNDGPVLSVQLPDLGRVLGPSIVYEFIVGLVPMCCPCKARSRESSKWVEVESVYGQANEYYAADESCKEAKEWQAGATKDWKRSLHFVRLSCQRHTMGMRGAPEPCCDLSL